MPQLGSTDQLLVLLLCDCGADLKVKVIGDVLAERKAELDGQHYVNLGGNKVKNTYWNMLLGREDKLRSSDLVLVASKSDICVPSGKLIEQMLRSDSVLSHIKSMLVNMLIERRSEFSETIASLQNWLREYLSSSLEQHLDWVLDQKQRNGGFYLYTD